MAKKKGAVCYICGRPATDIHHVFNGAWRSRSEEDGMVIPVCRRCHMYIHDTPTMAWQLKAEFQNKWESQFGDRRAFIERYGKSYI